MKTNLLLFIPSVIQIAILLWHMLKFRGRRFALTFIAFGLVFGLSRSFIINTIQLGLNDSIRPYEFGDAVIKIFGDPLQIYIGWITTAYLALCIAEMFLRKYQKEKANLFQIVSVAFLFITTFSYLVEATASVTQWWSWNSMLEAGFATSIFQNVPWVGIVDWGTVAFEFLAIYLLGSYALKTKRVKYLLLGLAFPAIHWLSHTNYFFTKLSIGEIEVALPSLIHLLIPGLAFILFFYGRPLYERSVSSDKSDRIILGALAISYLVCLFADLVWGQYLLISLIPISLLIMSLYLPLDRLNLAVLAFIVVAVLLPVETNEKFKLIFACYPLILINLYKLPEKLT